MYKSVILAEQHIAFVYHGFAIRQCAGTRESHARCQRSPLGRAIRRRTVKTCGRDKCSEIVEVTLQSERADNRGGHMKRSPRPCSVNRHMLFHVVVMLIAIIPAIAQAGEGSGGELQQKLAAIKQSVAENQQKLHQYQWTETTQSSVIPKLE